MDIKDKAINQKIIGCAFKVHNILGKGFLNNEGINLNVIFRFILPILKYPVNPVIYMDVVYAGFAWSKNLSVFFGKNDSLLLHPLILLKNLKKQRVRILKLCSDS